MDKFQFVIRLGDCYAELPFPKSLIREIKLVEIGILNQIYKDMRRSSSSSSRRGNKNGYIVYSINYLDNIIYIGRTNNIKIRQYQHNNLCFKKL